MACWYPESNNLWILLSASSTIAIVNEVFKNITKKRENNTSTKMSYFLYIIKEYIQNK